MSDELILEFEDEYIGSAVSPTVDITETTTDVTVTITDFQGDHSYTIEKTDQAIADAEAAATNANQAATQATATANQAAQYARDTADQAAADAQETADAAAARADTAAGGATQAAQAATQAAGTANTAAQNADAKAALADSKAALADQAATTANQAAQAAEAAKTAANTAAGQATTAAGNATTAAGTANTAAQNADAKAQLADTAAANADTATQAANTATTAATNAAQAANNAADVAIEAAEDMPRLVGTVDTAQTVADAWETAMEGATVYGKSVQDGTPTPDNPVPVQVVSGTIQLQTGETVTPIDLQGHTLAGLRNDVRDELTINAAGVKRIGQRVTAIDLSAVSWQWQSTWACWYTDYFTDMATVPSGATDQSYLICDTVLGNTANNIMSGSYTGTGIAFTATGSLGSRIVCKNGSTTDTPTGMFYYPLAEPVTHELGTITPPEIAPGDTLAIYASLDPDWQIEYTQDPNLVVHSLQSSIAPVEGSTASTNYAVGAYLMHGNQLYRVTSAIATGETIAPGTNCVACTVMGEVIRLTA